MRGRPAVAAAALALAACAGAGGAPDARRSVDSSVPPGPRAPATATTVHRPAAAPSTLPIPRPAPATGAPARALVTAGVALPVVAQVEGGWVVRTPCGATAPVRDGRPVAGADVVLDPGHGGAERGAVGPNGLAEADLNLAVAREAARALEGAGVSTILTRTADVRVTLATRAELAMALRPRAFVSVHHNADPDGPWPRPGTETYYQLASADSRRLAGLVWEEVVGALSRYRIAWVADTDAGAKYRRGAGGADYYGILRRTAGVPAVLAELAFLSNPPEADLLARPEVQRDEGEALARAIVRFLTTDDPGSGFTEPYPRVTPAGPGGGSRGCVDPPLR